MFTFFNRNLNPDILNKSLEFLDSTDLAQLQRVNSIFHATLQIPRILKLLTHYTLDKSELDEISALRTQGYSLTLAGLAVTNPVLMAIDLEMQANPQSIHQRIVFADPCGDTLHCSAFEYALLSKNFIVLGMMLNLPELRETKEDDLPVKILEKYKGKSLDLSKLIQDFTLFTQNFPRDVSDFSRPLCNQTYQTLIGQNFKKLPAWIAQLFCSEVLYQSRDNFLGAILNAQSVDLMILHRNYYTGPTGFTHKEYFYQASFANGLRFIGGFAASEHPLVGTSELEGILALDKTISEAFNTFEKSLGLAMDQRGMKLK